MSLSLLLIAKGVAVLWKTHAAHAAIMKAGAYHYDHYLAYCIAGWIKDNLWNKTADCKTQKEVAADITNNIFKYINGKKL